MDRFLRRLAAISSAIMIPTVAFAYLSYSTPEGSVGGAPVNTVGGSVLMWLNSLGQAIPSSISNPLPTTGVSISGYGKLSLTNASILLSTAALGPGSAAWPSSPAVVDVTNDSVSADTIYACPTGSTPTCTTATGIPIYVGETYRFTRPSATMTLIAASTATVEVQF